MKNSHDRNEILRGQPFESVEANNTKSPARMLTVCYNMLCFYFGGGFITLSIFHSSPQHEFHLTWMSYCW